MSTRLFRGPALQTDTCREAGILSPKKKSSSNDLNDKFIDIFIHGFLPLVSGTGTSCTNSAKLEDFSNYMQFISNTYVCMYKFPPSSCTKIKLRINTRIKSDDISSENFEFLLDLLVRKCNYVEVLNIKDQDSGSILNDGSHRLMISDRFIYSGNFGTLERIMTDLKIRMVEVEGIHSSWLRLTDWSKTAANKVNLVRNSLEIFQEVKKLGYFLVDRAESENSDILVITFHTIRSGITLLSVAPETDATNGVVVWLGERSVDVDSGARQLESRKERVNEICSRKLAETNYVYKNYQNPGLLPAMQGRTRRMVSHLGISSGDKDTNPSWYVFPKRQAIPFLDKVENKTSLNLIGTPLGSIRFFLHPANPFSQSINHIEAPDAPQGPWKGSYPNKMVSPPAGNWDRDLWVGYGTVPNLASYGVELRLPVGRTQLI